MNRFILLNDQVRKHAVEAVKGAPQGFVVEIKERTRTNDQNAILHQVLTEIAEQVEWHGQKFPVDIWKRLCVAAWLREEKQSPLMIPALDQCGVDVIYEKTSKLGVKQCSSLIDWCFAFGAEQKVKFRAIEYHSEGNV